METGDRQTPDLVRNLFQYSGMASAYRTYTNNLVFLVPDADLIENMVTQAQRYLAIQRILSDAERLREFTKEQRKKLKTMAEGAELDVRVAITRTYRHLFFPSHEVPTARDNLAHELLPAQDQGEVRKDQSEVVLRALKLQGKVLTGDDRPKSAQYVRARTWDVNQTFMSTEDLRKAFARRIQLPILLDPNQLKKTIKNGIETGVWVYYNSREGMGYDSDSPPPAIQIDDEIILYLPDEARRRNLSIKGKTPPPASGGDGRPVPEGQQEERCPVCGNPASACTCGQEIDLRPPLKGQGPVPQAFQQIMDACHDRGIEALSALRLTLQGSDRAGADHLRKIGLALSQMGRANFDITATYTAEFGAGHYINLQFRLNDTLYKRLKQATDSLAQEASRFHIDFTLVATYPRLLPLESDDFRTLQEVLITLNLGVITLEATAAETEAST